MIGNFRFERGMLLRLVFERLDNVVEKAVDLGPVVALKRLLERLVLDIDDGDFVHRLSPRFVIKSSKLSPPSESRSPCELTATPGGTTRYIASASFWIFPSSV